MSMPISSLSILTHFNTLDPLILEHVLDRCPALGIGVQHLLDNRMAVLGHQIVERLRGRGVCVLRAVLRVRCIRWVLGDSPGDFLELHAVKDNGESPYVDGACVVFFRSRVSCRISCE